jgi:hypothetical protein
VVAAPPRSHHKRVRELPTERPDGASDGSWGASPPTAERRGPPVLWAGRQPSSGYRGVYQARNGAPPAAQPAGRADSAAGRGGFRAEGRYCGRKFNVGNYFATAIDAATAYDAAARRNGVPEVRRPFSAAGTTVLLC